MSTFPSRDGDTTDICIIRYSQVLSLWYSFSSEAQCEPRLTNTASIFWNDYFLALFIFKIMMAIAWGMIAYFSFSNAPSPIANMSTVIGDIVIGNIFVLAVKEDYL